MHSKNFNLSVFFCIILYFASAFQSDGQLSYEYYDMSCPDFPHIVGQGVWNAMQKDARIAASILRLQFHDCFVQGCDASVLLVDTATFTGEQSSAPNNLSLRGFDVIDHIKANVEQSCPSTVSCADILALATREAVVIAGGTHWDVLLGRKDGFTANRNSPVTYLPTPFESLDKIAAKFEAKGLNLKDVVVLSGGHTIGLAQCFTFINRLYNFSGTSKPDPALDPSLCWTLQKTCPNNQKSSRNLAPLDLQSPSLFDNAYYRNLMNGKGLLQSDQALMSDQRTASLVKMYSEDSDHFMEDFAASMQKLATIGVLPTSKGEIRKRCGFVN